MIPVVNGPLAKYEHLPQVVQPLTWTDEEKQLIKDVYAKGATDSEFKLFLYNASNRGLDPARGQIYFIKRGEGEKAKVSFQVSIDGYRAIAERTGKWRGTERGVKVVNGKMVGWARVFRADLDHPIYEESPLSEYLGTSPNWITKPETMIKKIAEAAALRMAFPEQLGGTYIPDEMEPVDKVVNQHKGPTKADLKVLMNTIGQLISQYQLSDEEIEWATGHSKENLRSFKTINHFQILNTAFEDLDAWIQNKTQETHGEVPEEQKGLFEAINEAEG